MVQVRFENVDYSDEIKKTMEKVTSAESEKKAMLMLAEGRKESAKLEAEALLHKIEILQQNMPNMEHEKILEFLKSMDYISSMQNLSSSSNAKFVLYPSGDQQALDKIMRTEYLSQSMEKQS
ncbi:MAG TPA: hypothetical protein ENK86_04235 [Campylobacterales bacterium]|nr:hypothetical protein [Campylobacterales bacterium]